MSKSMESMCDDYEHLQAIRDRLQESFPREAILSMADDLKAELLSVLTGDANAVTMARLKGIDGNLLDEMQLLGLRLLHREVLLVRTNSMLHRVAEAIDSVT